MASLLLVSCCGACTTIEIRNVDGSVSIERRFGFAQVSIAPDAGVVTARISSFGYVATPLGYSAGWSRQTITTSDDGCRVIVWIDDDQDRKAIYQELRSVPGACISE